MREQNLLTLDQALEMLAAQDALNRNQIEQVRNSTAADDDRHPFIRIADLGLRSSTVPPEPLTLEAITRISAESCGMAYYRVDPLKLDVEAITSLVSQAYATRFQFLPVEVAEKQITVATAEPFADEWVDEISRILQRRIVRVLANPRDIERYLPEFYGVSRSISGASSRSDDHQNLTNNFEQLTELGSVAEPDANDQHIVHLVDWLLQYAFEQRASDIHIEPRRDQSNVRFRIDGVLHLIHQLPTNVVGAITSRIKSLGRMDVADKRRPQDGRVRTKSPGGLEVELRLSTMPTTFGEKLVMRIFDPEKLTQPFEALGFEDDELTQWNTLVEQPHGIVLVTGPTGSGKTTTLYSALKRLARPEINVCTIEDPIEMVEPNFNQMQVQPNLEIDFASGVRTLLRQDPDIIMIGEIRDKETAEVAIQAALTGHLVLSTLHTNDAPAAVTRLIDIGVPPFLIGATLLGVLAQRLVRTLCPACAENGDIDAQTWLNLVGHDGTLTPKAARLPVGCDECRHTGFRGRQGIYEIMSMDPELRALVKPGLQLAKFKQAAACAGMRSLRTSGALKVAQGLTTVDEVLSVVAADLTASA